jgi:anti-sigma factor RsiW
MKRNLRGGETHKGCRAVVRLLQAFLDGEIGDLRAIEVAEHLDTCLACGMEADIYRWLKAVTAGLARAHDPQQLERLERFAAALADGGSAYSGHPRDGGA